MADYLAKVTLRAASGIAEDDVVNDFSFVTLDPWEAADRSAATVAIARFYNATDAPQVPLGAQVRSVAARIGPSISRAAGACEVAFYRRVAPSWDTGSPEGVDSFTLGAALGGEIELPREVGVKLSFRADYGDLPERGVGGTRPRARRRGGVFIGPIVGDAVEAGVSGAVRVHSDFRNDLAKAGLRLWHEIQPQDAEHAVWSTVDEASFPVVKYKVDDAFDIQRRRGLKPALAVELTAVA